MTSKFEDQKNKEELNEKLSKRNVEQTVKILELEIKIKELNGN